MNTWAKDLEGQRKLLAKLVIMSSKFLTQLDLSSKSVYKTAAYLGISLSNICLCQSAWETL